jgi:hypothetical protein
VAGVDPETRGVAGRVLVALDESASVEAASFAAAWCEDGEAQRVGGSAVLIPVPGAVFFPGVVALVAIPLAVNLGSSALYDIVKRLLAGSRRPEEHGDGELEVVEMLSADGERLLVVRLRVAER